MNKFIEQANVEFNIEKIKSHIPTIEKYYTTEIENISNDLASQMLEIIRDVSIEYINQVQGNNIDN